MHRVPPFVQKESTHVCWDQLMFLRAHHFVLETQGTASECLNVDEYAPQHVPFIIHCGPDSMVPVQLGRAKVFPSICFPKLFGNVQVNFLV